MKTDNLVMHADDIGGVVGSFYGTPIVEANPLMSDLRELEDTQRRVRYFLGSPDAEIEILPGEVVYGHLIRRQTAAEVVGDAFYEEEIPVGKQVPLHDGVVQDDVAVGALITWRPGNQDFAVIHEEVVSELPA